MALDTALHARLGRSKATQTFLVIRNALRREMVLALMRIWDSTRHAIKMTTVAGRAKDKKLVLALGVDRAKTISWHRASEPDYTPMSVTSVHGIEEAMCADITQKVERARLLIAKYMEGGTHRARMMTLIELRNQRLAHHQLGEIAASGPDNLDDIIKEFYADNAILIAKLLSVVKGIAYDPTDTAGVYAVYAKSFWAGVEGERTEGTRTIGRHASCGRPISRVDTPPGKVRCAVASASWEAAFTYRRTAPGGGIGALRGAGASAEFSVELNGRPARKLAMAASLFASGGVLLLRRGF